MPDKEVLLLLLLAVVPVTFVIIVGILLTTSKKTKLTPRPSSWLGAFAKTMFWTFLAICALTLSNFFGPLGFPLMVLLGGLIVRYNFISRDTTATHVFSTIGASIRQNLPLSTSLQAEAGCLKGKQKSIFDRIAYYLTQGLPLSSSIKMGYSQCPGYALAMVTAAEKIDRLPQAISSIEKHLVQKSRESRKFKPVNPAYPLVIIAFVIFIVGGMMVFVFPSFERVFSDMGQSLPTITRVFINVSSVAGKPIATLMIVAVLVLIPAGIYLSFRPRRPEKPYPVSQVGDFLKWHLPVFHWFERNYSLIQTVSFLRLALGAGGTVDQAINGASQLDVNIVYRRKLRSWFRRVTQGESIVKAAKKCGVGSSLAWAFDDNVNPGNTLSILESIESFYRSNYGYLTNIARFIIWPCITILLAVGVGTIVYAFFAPLVALIDQQTSSILP